MGVMRKWVQVIFFFITNGYWNFPSTKAIYKGPLKVVCSPGLNCYSCPAATTYCPIGALQQILAGFRISVETGQFVIGFYVIGTMGIIGAFVGRMVCGWACPFGLFQELLHKIPSPKFKISPFLRYLKYCLLILMVILLPLFAIDEFGTADPWYCKYFCPVGTLEAGIPMVLLQPALQANLGWIFSLKIFILAFFIIWAVITSRPFCRTACPLGAFYALFSRFKLVKLGFDYNSCNHCGACHEVCPMGVRFNESPDDMECISCLSCSKVCKQNAIRVEIGGLPISAQQKKPKSNSI